VRTEFWWGSLSEKDHLEDQGIDSSSASIGTTTLSWVTACSTVVEHSQQEGFTECRCQRHVQPQLGGPRHRLEDNIKIDLFILIQYLFFKF
jgi:hypothetical protein